MYKGIRRVISIIAISIIIIASGLNNHNTQGVATSIDFSGNTTIQFTNLRDITTSGDFLYIAYEIEGFLIFDITDPLNPNFAKNFGINATSIVISGNFAYVTAGKFGLYIYDITTPYNAVIMNQIDYNPANQYFNEVVVSGGIAYINDLINGILELDVSNPGNPSFNIGPCDATANGGAPYYLGTPVNSTAIDGNFLYATENGNIRMFSIRCAGGGATANSTSVTPNLYDIFIHGSLAYIAGGQDGFHVFDTYSLNQMGYYDSLGKNMTDVFVYGNYAFVSQKNSQNDEFIEVLDIADNQNIKRLNINMQTGFVDIKKMHIISNYLFAFDYSGNVYIRQWDLAETIYTTTNTATQTQSITETLTESFTQTSTITQTTTNTSTQTITTTTTQTTTTTTTQTTTTTTTQTTTTTTTQTTTTTTTQTTTTTTTQVTTVYNSTTVTTSDIQTITDTTTQFDQTTTTQTVTAVVVQTETHYNQTSTTGTTIISPVLVFTTVTTTNTTTQVQLTTEISSTTKTQNITLGTETVSVYITSEAPLIIQESSKPAVPLSFWSITIALSLMGIFNRFQKLKKK